MLGLEEPPKTISFVASYPVRSSNSGKWVKKKKRPDSYYSDYMEVPSSLASPRRPMELWEEALAGAPDNNSHPSTSRNNRYGIAYRPFLAVLCFVTLALTAGSLLEEGGDSGGGPVAAPKRRNNPPMDNNILDLRAGGYTHHHHKPKKERGKPLPACCDKEEAAAADMYKAYKELQDDYHAKAFRPENKWKVLNQKDNIKVSLLEHDSDPTCPYVRMEAVMPTSVADCWEFLSIPNWKRTMPVMDPFYEEHKFYANYTHQGVNLILVRKKTKHFLTFAKRDFVFLSVSDQPLEDGTWVSGTVSVETPDIPREHGYTRAFQDSVAFYKPVHDKATGQEQCHLTIVCRIDLNDSTEHGSGGFIPMWLYVKTVGATGVRAVRNMRNALIEMKKEKEEEEQLLASAPTSSLASTTQPPMPSPIDSSAAEAVPQSDATSQLSSSTTITSTAVASEEPAVPDKKSWWNRARGGAAFMNPPVASQRRPADQSELLQRWKPLYEVFTHYPTHPKPEPTTANKNSRENSNLWGLSWLHRIPLLK
jgi:hypothetical protein